jgi:cellulose synthase operon protein YhjQ
MESRGTDRTEERASAETPEDVAVLYSWANLHGAKYRDFSASRREYRAQLRHRAAEQIREQALLAQAEAEAAAKSAESTARRAAESARSRMPDQTDSVARRTLREVEDAGRTAAAERLEAARRAEVAAIAEAAARREEREIAEAHASAQREAARYADSEIRRREMTGSWGQAQVPGQISDLYMPSPIQPSLPSSLPSQAPLPVSLAPPQAENYPPQRPVAPADVNVGRYSPASVRQDHSAANSELSQRRPQGYSPDNASGVRQIYRGPDASRFTEPSAEPLRDHKSGRSRQVSVPVSPIDSSQDVKTVSEQNPSSPTPTPSPWASDIQQPVPGGKRHTDPPPEAQSQSQSRDQARQSYTEASPTLPPERRGSGAGGGQVEPGFVSGFVSARDAGVEPAVSSFAGQLPVTPVRGVPPVAASPVRAVSPFSQAPVAPAEPPRGRRAQDEFGYQSSAAYSDSHRRPVSEMLPESATSSSQRAAYTADPAGPAWLYAPQISQQQAKSIVPQGPPAQSSVADTLQYSRERVAARWFALKGVFEQPGQEQTEAPVRQKETRTPVLAVFSLAGGVGKTSLVATVGRSLSSLGEKVLLTDTTSHGLLPFYFGASELRQGAVRTFSPPSGSTDAPIYLVSYEVDQKIGDQASQELMVEEIVNSSRGTHRILLDLTASSAWVVRHMARMNPTILVPVAPDMNSVISLQSVEKFFHSIIDADGRPVQPYYLLNQFDASLPLHLDVREVLRRQLGDRLLPFVIHRAPAVSEALAEGMTVVDYAPESAVAEDYLNVATWLRTIAAPATAGFRNVRWSER